MVTVAASLLLAVGIFTQTGLGQVVFAAAESKLVEISYSISEALGIERNIEPYANIVNQVVESNSTDMKLTDVIIDKDELIFSVITSTNQPVGAINFDYDIFINGKKIRDYSATGSSGPIDDSQTHFSSVYSVNITDIDTTNDMDIKVVLRNLTYDMEDTFGEKAKGKWEFEFVASGGELMANTHTIALDYGFNVGDERYTLEEFRYNPVNQKIVGKVNDLTANSGAIALKGKDSLGNGVEFLLTSVSGEDTIFSYQQIYGDLSNEIEWLTLTPYHRVESDMTFQASNNWEQVGDEFTIYLKQN